MGSVPGDVFLNNKQKQGDQRADGSFQTVWLLLMWIEPWKDAFTDTVLASRLLGMQKNREANKRGVISPMDCSLHWK